MLLLFMFSLIMPDPNQQLTDCASLILLNQQLEAIEQQEDDATLLSLLDD